MRNRCRPCKPVDTEAQRLEAAVEAGNFEAIPEIAAAYRRAVVLALAKRSQVSDRRALLQRARELLNRSLQLAKARRAHLDRRLASTAHSTTYEPPHRALHTWEVEG